MQKFLKAHRKSLDTLHNVKRFIISLEWASFLTALLFGGLTKSMTRNENILVMIMIIAVIIMITTAVVIQGDNAICGNSKNHKLIFSDKENMALLFTYSFHWRNHSIYQNWLFKLNAIIFSISYTIVILLVIVVWLELT